MEISHSSVEIFYVSRVLGLAPYSIKRDKKGLLIVKHSIIWMIYSAALVLTLSMKILRSLSLNVFKNVFYFLTWINTASLTYNGIVFDANSKLPIRPSFRMKSATSKVVTGVDISCVVMAAVAGLLCSIVGLQQTQDLNRRLKEVKNILVLIMMLNQVDDTLSLYTDEVKDRKRTYALMISVLLGLTFILGLDIWTWFELASNMSQTDHVSPKLNVQWYIPFYGLYYILMGLHIHFAQSAVGLGRRYRRLNLALKNSFQDDIKPNAAAHCADGGDAGIRIIQVSKMNSNNGNTSDPLQSTGLIPSLIMATTITNPKKIVASSDEKIINGGMGAGRRLAGTSKQHIIERLAYTHDSLGKAMCTISGAYGLAVLIMLASCLLHLVATSYFLFLEVLIKDDGRVSWLQALWIFFHIMRLLLIVEPCHITYMEAKQTVMIVCAIQRNCKDKIISYHLEKFWQQLIADNSDFTAWGMCTINRTILTSFSGAIATYLVILIQFQKTDG